MIAKNAAITRTAAKINASLPGLDVFPLLATHARERGRSGAVALPVAEVGMPHM